MNKPKVGQTVYSLNVGNAARNTEQKLTEFTVTKVGRKYFYAVKSSFGLPSGLDNKYYMETWREVTDYCENSKLYQNREDYEIDKERKDLLVSIKNVFQYGASKRLLLGQLREIAEIIKRHDQGGC